MSEDRFVVMMVGLPARGKTYISRCLCRYLNWYGIHAKVFNLGEYRRLKAGADRTHEFFDPANSEALDIRNSCALDALEDLFAWFTVEEEKMSGNAGKMVAFFDATNTTRVRRDVVLGECAKRGIDQTNVFMIESICDYPHVIQSNIQSVKISSPDYKNLEPDEAMRDFEKRIEHYKKAYEPLCLEQDKDLSFVKLINIGDQIVLNKVKGYLSSRMVYFLMNTHILPRAIYFTRHGESEFNVLGKIGGDANLSPRGQLFSKALHKFMEDQQLPNLEVWTSTYKRTCQTAKGLIEANVGHRVWRALDEIDAGTCDGLTYEDIHELYPEELARRDQDKFNYRYPRGESYADLVSRLEPVIMELERAHNVLVVGHQAVLRCLLAYYMDKTHDDLPYMEIPLHTVLKLTPLAYGCKIEKFSMNIEAVNTHRKRPSQTDLNRPASSVMKTVPPHE
eukprot:Nk52_evm25s2506 gene=Nk52_evmTU25s2506